MQRLWWGRSVGASQLPQQWKGAADDPVGGQCGWMEKALACAGMRKVMGWTTTFLLFEEIVLLWAF
jgi:hypothetical protein